MRYDAVIIGAGVAGRSAALVLGRARKKVALIGAGPPANLVSTGVGGFLGHDTRAPAELYAVSDRELVAYPSVQRHHGEVAAITTTSDSGWVVTTSEGQRFATAHVVLAMGMRYDHPSIPGIAPLWGASVFHCPFCHGWEHRDQRLAVLGGGPATVDRSLLLAGWTDDLTVIAPPQSLSVDDGRVLDHAGVTVIEGSVVGLSGDDRQLHSIQLDGGRVIEAHGLLVTAAHAPHSSLVHDLDLDLDETGHVIVDELGRTNLRGIWAVGDLTSPVSMVVRASATAALCAVWITHQQVAERFGLAFPPPGAPGGRPYGAALPSEAARQD